MIDLVLIAFVGLFLALGLKRPFIWVLAYIYIDIVAPQKIGWGPITALPLSLIAFVLAFGGWLILDRKNGSRFTFRQGLIAHEVAAGGSGADHGSGDRHDRHQWWSQDSAGRRRLWYAEPARARERRPLRRLNPVDRGDRQHTIGAVARAAWNDL
jgi:hypothetical protein